MRIRKNNKPQDPIEFLATHVESGSGSAGTSQSDCIIDVTELPKTYSWKGTIVPNTGYVENVYFNTELSVEEVTKILDEAQLVFNENIAVVDGSAGHPILLTTFDNGFGLVVYKSMGCYIITTLRGDYVLFNNSQETFGLDFVGWAPDDNGIFEINNEVSAEADGISIGAQNDKLSALFSSTPFKKEVLNFNNKAIYRLNETTTKYSGTPLVCNPDTYVENIYFNLSLSNDEILTLLKSLPYNVDESYNIIYATPNSTLTLYAYKYSEDRYLLCCNPSSLGLNMYVTLWSYQDGWEPKNPAGDNFPASLINNEYIIHINSVGSVPYDPGSGINNDLLSSLISSTPFEKDTTIPTGESDLYTYDGEWCKLVKERPLKVIDVSYIPFDVEKNCYFVDLTKNGNYIISTSITDSFYTTLFFGSNKQTDVLPFKPVILSSNIDVEVPSGYDELGQSISFNITREKHTWVYVKVYSDYAMVTKHNTN